MVEDQWAKSLCEMGYGDIVLSLRKTGIGILERAMDAEDGTLWDDKEFLSKFPSDMPLDKIAEQVIGMKSQASMFLFVASWMQEFREEAIHLCPNCVKALDEREANVAIRVASKIGKKLWDAAMQAYPNKPDCSPESPTATPPTTCPPLRNRGARKPSTG